jgi:TonB family protein
MVALAAFLACASLLAATNEPVYLGIDAKGVRHESKESAGNAPWMRDVAYTRRPSPLPGDRTRWYEGVGIFRLRIDPPTGATREITIVRSTGHTAFDRSALVALKLWRWKPQTWTQVDVPMLFQRGGGGPVLSAIYHAARAPVTAGGGRLINPDNLVNPV